MKQHNTRLIVFIIIALAVGATLVTYIHKKIAFDYNRSFASAIPATSDEFVGPFPSWSNVKVKYGARGDGVTDDTAAIQSGLNALGTTGNSSVLYFPAGTYRVT